MGWQEHPLCTCWLFGRFLWGTLCAGTGYFSPAFPVFHLFCRNTCIVDIKLFPGYWLSVNFFFTLLELELEFLILMWSCQSISYLVQFLILWFEFSVCVVLIFKVCLRSLSPPPKSQGFSPTHSLCALCFYLLFISFFLGGGRTCGIWKFPGQGASQSWLTPQPQQCQIQTASVTYTAACSNAGNNPTE